MTQFFQKIFKSTLFFGMRVLFTHNAPEKKESREYFGIIFHTSPQGGGGGGGDVVALRYSSNEWSQHMFSLRNKKSYCRIILIKHLIWSSV